ncbi:MAG: hypothetical protein SFZ03_05840 [Candidatus Melainabacteria bacterium]|nr:hypothetical protein [Candidatus Melainabacteria bacterium]
MVAPKRLWKYLQLDSARWMLVLVACILLALGAWGVFLGVPLVALSYGYGFGIGFLYDQTIFGLNRVLPPAFLPVQLALSFVRMALTGWLLVWAGQFNPFETAVVIAGFLSYKCITLVWMVWRTRANRRVP